jgi:hypothetical protein
MISHVRAALGSARLPWFVGIANSPDPIYIYIPYIAYYQMEIADTVRFVRAVEYSWLPHLPDGIHLTAEGSLEYGEIFAYNAVTSGLCR